MILNDRLRGGFSGCFPNVIVFAILNNIEERWNAKKWLESTKASARRVDLKDFYADHTDHKGSGVQLDGAETICVWQRQYANKRSTCKVFVALPLFHFQRFAPSLDLKPTLGWDFKNPFLQIKIFKPHQVSLTRLCLLSRDFDSVVFQAAWIKVNSSYIHDMCYVCHCRCLSDNA